MKTIIFYLFLTISLAMVGLVPASRAVVLVGGQITSDTIWTDRDIIVAESTVVVSSLARLTIEPGTIIRFNRGTMLRVYGDLIAFGETNAHITFTCKADTIGGTPYGAMWNGVDLQLTSEAVMVYCDLRYAVNLIQAYQSSPQLLGCTIENFSSRGVYVDGYASNPPETLLVQGCTIRQTEPALIGTGNGLFIFRNAHLLAKGTRANHCSVGVQMYSYRTFAPSFDILNCDLGDNARFGLELLSGG